MKKSHLFFITLFLFLASLGSFFYLHFKHKTYVSRTRDSLKLIASNSALSISADEIYSVPLEERSEGSPEYLNLYQKLLKIKEANPIVKYAYIMTSTNRPQILQYVVDADPVPEVITARCPTALPGDKYDAGRFPEMLEAFNAPSADKKISSDEWGTFISGYAPVKDANNRTAGILGVDADAAFLKAAERKALISGKVSIALAAISLFFLFFSLAKP